MLFEIASVDGKAISSAFDLGGKDFEDDIVMATALGTGADYLVTNNVKDFVNTTIPVCSPKDFLKVLA